MRLFILATVLALAVARPELYKEKEDFQYSRSSSDDGSKSGFYGAQRGNMGGNYERAHNMDTLAQHQMGGLVRQVQGELGDGSKTRTGSVFSAANSRGIYGSGRYDLSNLEGRNFQEGTSYDDTQSHSSLTSHNFAGQTYSGANSAGYGSSKTQNSRYHGYQAAGHSEQTLQSGSQHTSDVHALQNLQGSSHYDYDRQAAYTGYNTQSGVNSQSIYDRDSSNIHSSSGYDSNAQSLYNRDSSNVHSSSGYNSNAQSRYIATPVRIIVTPGTKVVVPVAQNYDAASVSSYDQSAGNSDAEVLHGNNDQQMYKPSSEPKHYESSYNYRKQWEKHDTKPVTVPLAVPTVYPFPKNSELYEDTQGHASDHQFEANGLDSHSRNVYRGYNANVNSASSSQSRHQSNYDTQHQLSSSSKDLNAYTHGAYNTDTAGSLINQVENSNTKPKSYQSSYSYHKSWERQGDPYVIKPASNGLYDGQSSQKLTAEQNHQGAHTSHQHGSHYHQSQQRYASSGDDCDENGHIRVARSYRVAQNQEVTPYQGSQNIYEGQEDLGQQIQTGWQNYEDLSQQSQSNWNNIENLGQQVQNKWDNLEDLGQQTQNLEDLGQQTQNLEDLGQQTQNLEDLGQQTQNLDDLGQQTQNLDVGGQQVQNKLDKLDNLGQQVQNQFDQQDMGQETQNTWDKLDLNQQSQTNLGQQPQHTWSTLETEPREIYEQRFEIGDGTDNLKQQSEDQIMDQVYPQQTTGVSSLSQHEYLPETEVNNNENIRPQEVHNTWNTVNHDSQTAYVDNFPSGKFEQESFEHQSPQMEDLSQQTQGSWSHNENFNQNIHSAYKPTWEQTADDTQQVLFNADPGTNRNQNIFLNHNHGGHFKPWIHHEIQHHHSVDFDHQTQTYGTSYLNAQTQNNWQELSSNNNNNFFNSQFHSSSSSPLSNFWNKIENIEKQFSDNSDNYHTQSSQDTYHNLEQVNTVTKIDNNSTHTLQTDLFSSTTGNIPRPTNVFTTSTSTTENSKDEEVLHYVDKLQPQDIGRGDIGPEDLSSDLLVTEKSYNLINDRNKNSSDKIHKTTTEIEQLSLNDETGKNNKLGNKTHSTNENQNINQNNTQKQYSNKEITELNTDLSVLSLDQQKLNKNIYQQSSSLTNRTQIEEFMLNAFYENQSQINKTYMMGGKTDFNGKLNLAKQDVQHQTSNFTFGDLQNNKSLEQNPIEIDPQSMYQQFEGIRESNENNNKLHLNGEIENLNQQNIEQQFDNFGQQSESFNQESKSLAQQNLYFDQQSQNFEKHNENFVHPNEQLENQFDFGQQNENLDQLQTAWSNNFDDLNQQIQTVALPNENLFNETVTDLQHADHQLEILEHPSATLDQQSQSASLDKFEDLNQQVQAISKPSNNIPEAFEANQHPTQQLEILEQQSQNLDQQSLTGWSEKLEDPSQKVQFVSKPYNNIQQMDQQVEGESHPEAPHNLHHPSNLEERINSVTQKNIVIETPPEPATEKSGFWKSIGSKFVSAKDKVYSWFGSSS